MPSLGWLGDMMGVAVRLAGALVGQRKAINFSSDFTVVDDPANDRVDVGLVGGSTGGGSGTDPNPPTGSRKSSAAIVTHTDDIIDIELFSYSSTDHKTTRYVVETWDSLGNSHRFEGSTYHASGGVATMRGADDDAVTLPDGTIETLVFVNGTDSTVRLRIAGASSCFSVKNWFVAQWWDVDWSAL